MILRQLQFPADVITLIRTSLKPYQVHSQYLGINIDVERGVPQGWSLSCVLFNIAIDPLLRTLSHTLPDLFQSAFADDLSFHHDDHALLPIVQRFIDEYGNAIGLSVNQRKCAIICLESRRPDGVSIWNSPFVNEYKYLGILLGLNTTVEDVFKQTIQKLRKRALLFSSIKANLTTRILIAKIYLYPLLSYILNFYSFPKSTERAFCSIIQYFIFPCGNIKAQLLFSFPNIIANRNL
eukprot:TRINITY_DN6411_c0_g1_i1.p1 TRINITY_DN6411_c0_g1~~TRINITY_DN6411_c0_g1_i1.p1  ORF type:complete len:237 (-),score=18.86 TRINITY_DN6411_c0_g1_i1:1145-1855(-)